MNYGAHVNDADSFQSKDKVMLFPGVKGDVFDRDVIRQHTSASRKWYTFKPLSKAPQTMLE